MASRTLRPCEATHDVEIVGELAALLPFAGDDNAAAIAAGKPWLGELVAGAGFEPVPSGYEPEEVEWDLSGSIRRAAA